MLPGPLTESNNHNSGGSFFTLRCHFSVPSNGRVMLNAVAVVVVAAGLDAQQESETFQIIFLSLCCHQHGTKFDSSFWLKPTLIIQSHSSEVVSKFEEPDNTGSFTESTENCKKNNSIKPY